MNRHATHPRSTRRRTVVALLTVVAALAGPAWVWSRARSPVILPPEGVTVRIDRGWSTRQVAEHLAARGLIRQAWLFTALAKWRQVDRRIHAGDYRFAGRLTPGDILDALQSPLTRFQLVTIPEGRSAVDVMELLAAAGLGGADLFACISATPDFLLDLDLPSTGVEGYLFPDTYAFPRSTPAARVLRTMVRRYREHAARLTADRLAVGLTEHAMVTLASMIEKETGAALERPLISAVFHNRLRRGIPLQSDPTAVYERPNFRGPITRADLASPSAYNTYQRLGLPPGPICNPGLAALEAAVRPAAVGYLYFVSRNDGTHAFSTTLAEHLQAVARYRR